MKKTIIFILASIMSFNTFSAEKSKLSCNITSYEKKFQKAKIEEQSLKEYSNSLNEISDDAAKLNRNSSLLAVTSSLLSLGTSAFTLATYTGGAGGIGLEMVIYGKNAAGAALTSLFFLSSERMIIVGSGLGMLLASPIDTIMLKNGIIYLSDVNGNTFEISVKDLGEDEKKLNETIEKDKLAIDKLLNNPPTTLNNSFHLGKPMKDYTKTISFHGNRMAEASKLITNINAIELEVMKKVCGSK